MKITIALTMILTLLFASFSRGEQTNNLDSITWNDDPDQSTTHLRYTDDGVFRVYATQEKLKFIPGGYEKLFDIGENIGFGDWADSDPEQINARKRLHNVISKYFPAKQLAHAYKDLKCFLYDPSGIDVGVVCIGKLKSKEESCSN